MENKYKLIAFSIIIGCVIAWLSNFREWWQWLICIVSVTAILVLLCYLIVIIIGFLILNYLKRNKDSIKEHIRNRANQILKTFNHLLTRR